MSCQVFRTDDAAHDSEDGYDYIAFHDVPGKAGLERKSFF
jgi:hypothetical protein